ncbi:MAG: thiol:disulfide interchange protein, partial [Verrucomicrobiaceae bacterium]
MHRLFFLLLFIFQGVAQAQKSGGEAPASTAELIPENRTIAPGDTFTLALKLDHPAEWHSYYQNSGGVELPPSIAWKLPPGFTAGPIQWPTPEVKDGYFGKSFVYSGSPVFLIDITAPASLAAGGTVSLSADASWQICKESCISEEKSFSLILTAAPTAEKDPAQAALFAQARKNQPANVPSLVAQALSTGGDITLRVKA